MEGGVLTVGQRLPTVRQLARDLALAPGTVARGYQLLESDGVIETRGRRGSFVAAGKARQPEGAHAQAALTAAARRYLAEAQRLGVSVAAALAAVDTAAATAGLEMTNETDCDS